MGAPPDAPDTACIVIRLPFARRSWGRPRTANRGAGHGGRLESQRYFGGAGFSTSAITARTASG
jgi:hypothetical protein